MSVKLSGAPELKKALAKFARRYPGATARALYEEGFGIQRESVPLAPVEFAVLRTSAYTTPPTGPYMTVEAGYGTEYAVYPHEMMGLRHPRGGQAKYLEEAVNRRRSGVLERLQKRIKQSVESGQDSASIPIQGPTRPHVKRVSRKGRKKRRRLKARRRRR